MTPRRTPAALLTVVLTAVVAAGCTGSPDGAPTGGSPTSGASPSVSATPPGRSFELTVNLRDLRVRGVRAGLRPRRLREPTRAIRATMTDLYRIGFVDPSEWAGGTFPDLLPLFAGEARAQAEGDLQRLTLGRQARELDAVRPRPARLDVTFLADARNRPVVAVADLRFEGVGLGSGGERRIRQEGEYTLRRVNGRWRIVGYDVLERTIEGPERAAFVPGFPSSDPMFILVIGSDARPGQSVTQTRADSLHIVGVNPRTGRASVLGIPRDSWVPIPGHGTSKINASLAIGGPDLVVQTVERLSGIRIDAYILTGFQGFERIVGEVGGIDITIPFPISDRYAHAQFRRGHEHLSANEALAFSRARHALPNGDFGRSLNQGRLLIAALSTFRAAIASRGTSALLPWAIAAARDLHTDLSMSDVVDLLLSASAFAPGRIRNEVVDGRVGSVGGLSVVFLSGQAFAQFRDLGRDGTLGG